MLHGPKIRSGVEVRCVSGKTFASDLQSQVELGLAGVNPSPFCKLRPALFKPRILAYNTSTATVLTFPSHAFLTQHVAVFLGSLFNSILCNCLNKSFVFCFSQEFFVFFLLGRLFNFLTFTFTFPQTTRHCFSRVVCSIRYFASVSTRNVRPTFL